MNLSILYRGPLSSCNYGCRYCPFAKHKENRAEHAADNVALQRFVNWALGRTQDQLSILFTPWGEALIRSRYQQALAQLTNAAHIEKVAIQTNLTCKLDWVEACDKSKLALWTTYHPTQTSRERFLQKCAELSQRGVAYSVGVVGLAEQADEIAALRQALRPEVYLWINAYKDRPAYYSPEMVEQFTALDPHFPTNLRQHASRGQACRTGHSVISVDGDGNFRRCHFVRQVLGNIYEPGFEGILQPRPCPKMSCGCYIGYTHLEKLDLAKVYGTGLLERIPLNSIVQGRGAGASSGA